MRPRFPSLRIGTPVERGDVVVYPLFLAQLNLFDKFDQKPFWSVADSNQQRKVLACNRRIDGPKFPSIANQSNIPLLFLPGDRFMGMLHLNSSVIVPPKTVIKIPSLCYVSAYRVLGSPMFPPPNAVGWVACGFYSWEMHVFQNPDACKQAGWRRRLTLYGNPGTDAARQDVEAFVHLPHRLDFQRVKSPTPGASDWVASNRVVQASALFFNKQFVHLRSVRNLRGE